MKIKIDNIEYETEFVLPERIDNAISVQFMMDSWRDLIREQEIKEKRALRLKKINEINAKYNQVK